MYVYYIYIHIHVYLYMCSGVYICICIDRFYHFLDGCGRKDQHLQDTHSNDSPHSCVFVVEPGPTAKLSSACMWQEQRFAKRIIQVTFW